MKVLIAGSLHEAVSVKMSKSGNPYAIGKMKEDVTPISWVSVSAFGTLAETLAGMRKGDSLSVSGTLTADIYTPPGKEPRVNLSITADNILPLKPLKKPATSGSDYKKHDNCKNSFDAHKPKQGTSPPYDDDCPFLT